jgi:hypothetical protein
LRELLLQVLYTVRSEPLLMEQLGYNFLFRWFVGLGIDDPGVERNGVQQEPRPAAEGRGGGGFLCGGVGASPPARTALDEHFTVDCTLIEAWAGQKSFKRKVAKSAKTPPDDDPGKPTVNFHGEERRNDTHQSNTDREALLARKGQGKESKLSYAAHVFMENRNGLAVNCRVTQATGRAEREAALAMVGEIPGWRRGHSRC